MRAFRLVLSGLAGSEACNRRAADLASKCYVPDFREVPGRI